MYMNVDNNLRCFLEVISDYSSAISSVSLESQEKAKAFLKKGVQLIKRFYPNSKRSRWCQHSCRASKRTFYREYWGNNACQDEQIGFNKENLLEPKRFGERVRRRVFFWIRFVFTVHFLDLLFVFVVVVVFDCIYLALLCCFHIKIIIMR